MKNLTLKNMAAACGGRYVGAEAEADTEITAVVTDSRRLEQGCLFAAIRGKRVDGHDYIPQACEQGAVCILSERELKNSTKPYIKVDDTIKALQDIAEFYRRGLDVKVIGITGSVGKTSTKEMAASILSTKYRVLKTLGNFNNGLGLPLTIFRLTKEDEVAVLEMGISDFGEMRRLARIARPDICVFTNIGMCHLEQLHTRDGILQAKTEMFEYMAEDGCVIINGDDDRLSAIEQVKGKKPYRYGMTAKNDVYLLESENLGLKGTRCSISTPKGEVHAVIPIPGKHMIYNAMAGVVAGLILNLDIRQLEEGIEKLLPLSGRNNLIETQRYTIIDDCYNANPVSMRASVDVLANALTRKVCILGDMGELGTDEARLHKEVGAYAAKHVDLAVFIGRLAAYMQEGFLEKRNSHECAYFETAEAFMERAGELLSFQDTILVKASHFMEFTRIIDFLKNNT